MVILELIHAKTPDFRGRVAFISYSEPIAGQLVYLVIIMTERIAFYATVRSSF
jgi:hypothetical protein